MRRHRVWDDAGRMELQSTPTALDGPQPEGEPGNPAPDGGDSPGEVAITWTDAACVGPIILVELWILVGGPLTPSLISSHPVLLALLRGSLAAMIACGSFARVGRLPLWQGVLAPLPILMVADPFIYWAGRRYGRLALDHYRRQGPRVERRIDRAERFFARYGVWTILFSALPPVSTVAFFLFLAAGETRMPFWRFILADLASNLMYVGGVVALGWFLGQRGVDVAESVGHYGLLLSGVVVVVTVALVVRRTRAQLRSLDGG